jgi:hypothetical protein
VQRNGDPWTDSQVRLTVVAVVLAFCCLVTSALNAIHDHMVAQTPETLATHLAFPVEAKRVSPPQMKELQCVSGCRFSGTRRLAPESQSYQCVPMKDAACGLVRPQ